METGKRAKVPLASWSMKWPLETDQDQFAVEYDGKGSFIVERRENDGLVETFLDVPVAKLQQLSDLLVEALTRYEQETAAAANSGNPHTILGPGGDFARPIGGA